MTQPKITVAQIQEAVTEVRAAAKTGLMPMELLQIAEWMIAASVLMAIGEGVADDPKEMARVAYRGLACVYAACMTGERITGNGPSVEPKAEA